MPAGAAALPGLWWWSGDMRLWARLERGVVCELQRVSGAIDARFHPAISWLDVTSVSEVRIGRPLPGFGIEEGQSAEEGDDADRS
jgi:hypothetical protein